MSSAVAILAGGKATRMGGRQKAFLMVGGRRIIDRQLEVLRSLFDEILVVANDLEAWGDVGVPVIPDVIQDKGPLAGILTALEGARAEKVVVLACDMPDLHPRALELIRDAAPEADVVVPVVGGRPEPLHARYARRVMPEVRRRIIEGDLKIAHFYYAVTTHWIDEGALRDIDPDLRFLANFNSPDDLSHG